MASGVTYLVFLLPIVFSFVFGGAVLAQVLQEPDRELNMMQFGEFKAPTISSKSISILGLESQYTTSEPVSVQISVTDDEFDCGDLYITIYHSTTKEVVTQSGFFDQCFATSNSVLPMGDNFSELVDEPGTYEIKVDISDKNQKESLSVKGKFTVK
ncbi:MAG: hypothetical protein R3230_05665 [Nitrosopumilaceae archaeon]|nr:hypothetical protein [Nitrosopumilaceae archaeon]